MGGGTDAENKSRTRGGEGDAHAAALKVLLAAMEGSARRVLTHSRAAGALSVLEVALLLSVAASLAAYVFTGGAYWQLAAAGVASAAAAVASSWLQSRLYGKMLNELDRLELPAAVAALATGRTDIAQTMLMEKVKELKKRRRGGASK
ncbi:MAG: hypothetical protein ACO2PM_07540 [Pyrobaculum sp.]